MRLPIASGDTGLDMFSAPQWRSHAMNGLAVRCCAEEAMSSESAMLPRDWMNPWCKCMDQVWLGEGIRRVGPGGLGVFHGVYRGLMAANPPGI